MSYSSNYCDQCGANLEEQFQFRRDQPMLFYCLHCKPLELSWSKSISTERLCKC